MIDRPIRPGFADGFKQEVHIVATTLCVRRPEPARLHLRGRRLCRASVRRHPVRRPGRLRAHRPQRRDRRVHREPHLRRVKKQVRPRAHHRWHQRLHLYGRSRRSRKFPRKTCSPPWTFGQQAIAAFCEKQAEFLAKVAPEPKEYPVHVRRRLHRRARRRPL